MDLALAIILTILGFALAFALYLIFWILVIVGCCMTIFVIWKFIKEVIGK